MAQITDPRFLVLEKLQNGPRTEAELFRSVPQPTINLRRALGFLREQDLVKIDAKADHAKVFSNVPLNQTVETSFTNFLKLLVRLVRTVRSRPNLHDEIVRSLQNQLSQFDSLAGALGDLFFQCLAGEVPSPFAILNDHWKEAGRQSRMSISVSFRAMENGRTEAQKFKPLEEHEIILNLN